MGKVAKNTVHISLKPSMILSKTRHRREQRVKHRDERITRFDDLPDEVLLIICRYLNPAHVLKAFLNYDKRMFRCITKYRQNIDLTKSSYTDFKYILNLLANGHLRPSTLTISNAQIPTQMEIFAAECVSSKKLYTNDVRRLSLLECTEDDLCDIESSTEKFSSLQSLRIVEFASVTHEWPMSYPVIESLRDLMFNNTFDALTELELSTNDGIVLDKQLYPNSSLKRLTISLQKVEDLFVLFDGLTPNLIELNVTLCKSSIFKRSPLPQSWSRRFMSHLVEFRLITYENVSLLFDHLRGIVVPLIQLEKLTLDIRQWVCDEQGLLQGNQLEKLFDQFMPRLRHFHCSIQTMDDIDMQSFATLSERWPIACGSVSNSLSKYVYTIPWSFEELYTSMLADDDIASVCPNVRNLTVDKHCTNLSHRFPNIDTLSISPGFDLTPGDCVGFRRLCHLATANIKIVPFPARHIHTLTLIETNDLRIHPIIYPNVHHLILENSQINLLSMVTALVKHFPNLHSLEIEFEWNTDYFDSLDVLLDGQHLPHLSLLKTDWIDEDDEACSNIEIWITANTPLKWKSTPFYGNCDDDRLTIGL